MCSRRLKALDEITMKRYCYAAPPVIALFALFSFALSPNTVVTHADGDATDPALYSNDWRTTGPPGGDVRALVVDPRNPDRFYFGTLDGQIYTSADGGKRGNCSTTSASRDSSSTTSSLTPVIRVSFM